MSVTRLLLWRHGNTVWNRDNRVQGQTDTPLSELGRRQAEETAPLLAALRPDAIVSSDLHRAADTAAALAQLTGLPVRPDPRLRERYFGQWQGLTMAEIPEKFPDEYARWRAGAPSPGCGLETVDDLGKRVAEALQEAADITPGGVTVMVTHGGAARQGCGMLLGWPAELARTLGPLANCHWTELGHDPVRGWQLRAHNVGR